MERKVISQAGSQWLDDPHRMAELDRQGFLDKLESFDRQVEESRAMADGMELGIDPSRVGSILFCGLGGSAIGGDLLRAYLGDCCRLPMAVCRNYTIPGYVDRSTLAVVCSYSGNTEETLSAFEQARKAGAPIICVSSGGELADRAEASGYPLIRPPSGLPPRAATGYMTIPLLLLLGRTGLWPDRSREVAGLVSVVEDKIAEYGAQTPWQRNPAKKLALKLTGAVTIVYGSQDRLDVVARRWASQLAENAKQLAYFGRIPEITHNEIAGWKHPRDLLEQIRTILLRDPDDHPRVQIRSQHFRQYLEGKSAENLEIWSEGEDWLARLWGLILLGDYASVYLALANGEDPTAIEAIEDLKEYLQGRP